MTTARPAPATVPSPQTDALVHWLLSGLALHASVFHVGQYCGPWQASTAGRQRGSFHLVLHGRCWLHRPGQAPLALQAGDSLFLLRDLPHQLCHEAGLPGPSDAGAGNPMQPMQPALPGSTGLACGFFSHQGALGALLLGALPPLIVLRADDPAAAPVASLMALVRAEAAHSPHPDAPAPLVGRLVEAMLFYALRQAARADEAAAGLWALARCHRLAPLLGALLQAPAEDWPLDRMARQVHLSRASFCRQFSAASGHSPAEFVLRLRMNLAAQQLRDGRSVEQAAAAVGYASGAAFSRAFQRVLGKPPRAWRQAPAAASAH